MSSKPLAGRTVLVAASEERVGRLAGPLRDLGAEVIPFPTVRIVPRTDLAALDESLRLWRSFDWIVFTSTNGVDASLSRAAALDVDLAAHPAKIAAVGPATSAAAEAAGLSVRVVPDEYITDRIASALGDLCGQSVLLLRSSLASGSLAEELRARGANVRDVAAYDAVLATPDLTPLRAAGRIDLVLFTSASAARNLAALLPAEDLDRLRAEADVACIGPVTAEAVRELGFRIAIVAEDHTAAGLVRALEELAAHG